MEASLNSGRVLQARALIGNGSVVATLPMLRVPSANHSGISTTRVTVTRVLGKLRDEGWLQIDASRHLVVTGAGRR